MKKDHAQKIIEKWKRERPDLDASSTGIIGRILRLERIITKSELRDYSKFGLNTGEFDVLAGLRRSGKPYCMTPTQLFSSLMISSGAMTNRLDRLENVGLIQRSADPNDRRGVRVRLTARGLDLINEGIKFHVEQETRLVQGLTTAEQDRLASLLRKLLLSLEDE